MIQPGGIFKIIPNPNLKVIQIYQICYESKHRISISILSTYTPPPLIHKKISPKFDLRNLEKKTRPGSLARVGLDTKERLALFAIAEEEVSFVS